MVKSSSRLRVSKSFKYDGSDKEADYRRRSRTYQSYADEADINVVVGRYLKSGSFYDPMTEIKARTGARRPIFDDFRNLPGDLTEAVELVQQAEEAFDALPAVIRDRFQNDPSKLLETLNNPGAVAEIAALERGVGGVTLLDVTPPTDTEGVKLSSDSPSKGGK